MRGNFSLSNCKFFLYDTRTLYTLILYTQEGKKASRLEYVGTVSKQSLALHIIQMLNGFPCYDI